MPTKNQASFITESIKSVLSQDYTNLELIVLDGQSTDETPNVVQSIAVKDRRVRYFSGTDSGPSQAINKGLSLAKGTIIGWLNSDDLYTQGAIQRAVSALKHDENLLMVYGEGSNINELGDFVSNYPTLPPSTPIDTFVEGCFISQPTVFFHRTLNLLLGRFDESLKTAFDFDYWLKAFKRVPNRIGYIVFEQARTRLHSNTITSSNRKTVMLEGIQILNKHLGLSPKNWVLTYIDEITQSNVLSSINIKEKTYSFFEEAKPYLNSQDEILIKQRLNVLLTN
jgi:glycosyltransferase involved in cell wall biosynthesis